MSMRSKSQGKLAQRNNVGKLHLPSPLHRHPGLDPRSITRTTHGSRINSGMTMPEGLESNRFLAIVRAGDWGK